MGHLLLARTFALKIWPGLNKDCACRLSSFPELDFRPAAAGFRFHTKSPCIEVSIVIYDILLPLRGLAIRGVGRSRQQRSHRVPARASPSRRRLV